MSERAIDVYSKLTHYKIPVL